MSNSQALRRTVLHIAAAHPQDRRWLLAQLPAPQRQRVQSLLAELKALGIRDAAACRHLLEQQPAETATGHAPGDHAGMAMPTPAAVDSQSWIHWLLAQPQAEQLPFDLRVLLSAHSDGSTASSSEAGTAATHVPPAWLPTLREFLAEAPA
jgi:hypothetical protein